MARSIFYLMLFVSFPVMASETTGVCTDCQNGQISKKSEQFFQNTIAQAHDSIQWYCEPNSRKLFITNKSKVINDEFLVTSYNNQKDCHSAEEKLNRLIPRIANTEGRFIENEMLICFHDKFYLVRQNTPLDQIKTKGKKLNTIEMQSADDCSKFPQKYMDAISTVETLKLIRDPNRVDSAIQLIKKHQKEFLTKKFR